MNRAELEEALRLLALGNGRYARLLYSIKEAPADVRNAFYAQLEQEHFNDILDLILYLEG